MEHISQHLAPIVKLETPSTLPEKLKTNLLPEEQKILQLKYASKPFCKMSGAELSNWSIGLLTKIHIITGWILPPEELLDVLLDQFQKKLVESYPNTNVDEVEYAFRTGGTTVKDWGKNMNLSLIDEVMIPYLESRKSVSRIEEQKKIEAPKEKESLTDQAMNDWMNEIIERMKGGKYPVEFMPEQLYEWLVKTERLTISNAQKKQYMELAIKRREAQVLSDFELDRSKLPLAVEFRTMQDEGKFTGEELLRLKTLAKKMVVYDYLKEKE